MTASPLILVVDDNAPNREYLQTLLSYKGHRVIVAVDGREALPLIRSERPDLVIADLLMPNMDGFELTHAVRSDAALAHTAIIYCTATYHAREVEMLARSLGVLQIIEKPSEPEAILKLVDAVLAGADYIVVGRPITKASVPRLAVQSIMAELQAAEATKPAAMGNL